MRLEAISSPNAEAIPLPLAENSSGILISDWSPMLPFLMKEDISPAERGSIFHASLARIIVDQALAIRVKYGITRVGLTGGVFQNRLLTERALCELAKLDFEVYLHEALPSGDGGISFGQIIEAGNKIQFE